MIDPAFIPRPPARHRFRPLRPERQRRSFSVLLGFMLFLSLLIGPAILNTRRGDEPRNAGAAPDVPAPKGQFR